MALYLEIWCFYCMPFGTHHSLENHRWGFPTAKGATVSRLPELVAAPSHRKVENLEIHRTKILVAHFKWHLRVTYFPHPHVFPMFSPCFPHVFHLGPWWLSGSEAFNVQDFAKELRDQLTALEIGEEVRREMGEFEIRDICIDVSESSRLWLIILYLGVTTTIFMGAMTLLRVGRTGCAGWSLEPKRSGTLEATDKAWGWHMFVSEKWGIPLLVGGLEHFLFSHILGIIIPID